MNEKQAHDSREGMIPRPADPPPALAELADERWRGYAEAGGAPVAPPALARVLRRVWACSEYVAGTCSRYPSLLPDLIRSGDLFAAYAPGEYRCKGERALSKCADPAALMAALRRLRHRELVRIAWRDLAGWAPVRETLRELSDLAEACIEGALERLHHWHQGEHGVPVGEDSGEPQCLVVIAMGKLGARELNFSSDVDLIFTYPEDGATRGHGVSNQQFFIELGQRLLRVLSEVTEDGFAYRTDMRLRPFGESGPLAVSFDALEDYYQTHGRSWERYAMVRARPVTGEAERPRPPHGNPAPVRLPPLPGLQHLSGTARDEAAHCPGSGAQGPGAQHQARRRGHTRDRVHHPHLPAGPRRPPGGASGPCPAGCH